MITLCSAYLFFSLSVVCLQQLHTFSCTRGQRVKTPSKRNLLRVFAFVKSRPGLKLFETWDKKLGHQAKSNKSLVSTLEVTF